jgi:hypothetical protein
MFRRINKDGLSKYGKKVPPGPFKISRRILKIPTNPKSLLDPVRRQLTRKVPKRPKHPKSLNLHNRRQGEIKVHQI